jgi:hypothetical protein
VTTATVCAFDQDCPGGETCNLGADPSPRYVDNGDGTVTDRRTCLVWEQKTGAYDASQIDCSTTTCSDPHEVDNVYAWRLDANNDVACDNVGDPPDGGAFTDFLAKLNTAGFAGHADWRLPESEGNGTSGEPAEQESILLSDPCGSGACIDLIFGPSAALFYWSATTFAPGPYQAWGVNLVNGGGGGWIAQKAGDRPVRAVRGGP